MKKLLGFVFLLLLLACGLYYKDNIADYLTNEVVLPSSNNIQLSFNNYKYEDWQFVQNTEDFVAHKYEDFNNIFYTILNSGSRRFTFYCDENYLTCKEDLQRYINEDSVLGNINNLVHPYNSFKNIQVSITSHNKATITVSHIYSKQEMDFVNQQIDTFITTNINDTMSDYQKIQAFHDYIVNTTKYDQYSINTGNQFVLKSYNAYGLFLDHLAICGGYTDALAIYLNRLGYKNYRVATNSHIWNLVLVNGTYLHIDATWDDPVTSNGSDQLLHDFFLINSYKLHQLDSQEHNYDTNVYREAN